MTKEEKKIQLSELKVSFDKQVKKQTIWSRINARMIFAQMEVLISQPCENNS